MSLLLAIARRWTSPTFKRSFALILAAEAVTILTAWLLLDANISRWLHARTIQTIRISEAAATSADWSLVDTIPKAMVGTRDGVRINVETVTPLFEKYRRILTGLTDKYFGEIEGDVYLVVVDKGTEYRIDPFDQHPMDLMEKGNDWEAAAYKTGRTTYMTVPHSDISGTYIAAYTPIFRDSKVVGLMAAEYDSATLADFRALVRKTFWYSILPALLLSLVVAYALAAMFVDPMELFRRIDASAREAATTDGAVAGPLSRLSPREREIAELVRQGLKNREIAERLVVTPETVKQHLKNIKEKTGFTRVDLAVHVEASRRSAQGAPAAP